VANDRRKQLKSTESVPFDGSHPPSEPYVEPLPDQLRVLVVGLASGERTAVVAALRAAGCHVVTARDLRSAVEAATRQQPRVVVTELELPDVRGFQFARSLRTAIDHDVTLVGVTNMLAERFEVVRRAGFDLVLTTPVDADALAAQVRALRHS
jgi:DNA-binding response OmpR family regulator